MRPLRSAEIGRLNYNISGDTTAFQQKYCIIFGRPNQGVKSRWVLFLYPKTHIFTQEGDQMQNTKKIRCACYVRVSTEEQHLNGLSLPAQRKALLDYAEACNYTVVDIYADEGISARKSMKNRKGLLRLLEDVKQGKIDMILVTKLDRWFRNIKDYNITEEILQTHNCHWKTIFENYDSSTANGQMVINIMLSVNQAECDRTSERIKAVFDYKRSKGEVISGMAAPYGYTVIDNHIVKDRNVSHIVDDAFNCYFSCYSIRQVIKYIQEKYGDTAPTVYMIDKFFKNEKYAGKCKSNLNYCEPYISLEQFNRIQTVTQSKIKTKNGHTYIFSSLLKCPICGRSLSGFSKTVTTKSGVKNVYYRYRCCSKYDRHSSPCITESVVEDYMLQHVLSKLATEHARLQVRAEKSHTRTKTKDSLSQELDRLNIMFQKGRISEDFYDQEYARLEAELRQQDDSYLNTSIARYSELIGTFSGDWLELYHKLDNSHKNVFWKSTIKEIRFDKDTHKICGFDFLI